MRRQAGFRVLLLPFFGALASCGGGSSDAGGRAPPPASNWQSGVFQSSSTFDNRCVNPRAGSSDRQGTRLDENNWLRSWTNELYLWYGEVMDRDPALYDTAEYFDLLKTDDLSPSGQPKDKFHFTYDTDVWVALSQGGTSAGYGAEFAILAGLPPRRIVVAFTEAGSPAAAQLARGDEILEVDGADAVDGDTQQIVDILNAGLFPEDTGESHTFLVRNTDGVTRTVNMTSANVVRVPVPIVDVLPSDSGPVGYIQFNDHIATAEDPLIEAIEELQDQAVTDLILDLRYNGGGYLDLASELAYMIANTTLTTGQTFEKLVFNDKHTTRDPVTGETLVPTPFHTTSQGFGDTPVGNVLPSLNLDRVYVITGPGTCSASESIINGLRGVGVEVYVIGSTTCGKPYGFYPTDNCGTTYFSIQFRGENAADFGDYSDGFSPANQAANVGAVVPGCSVADDFTNALGDPAEARIAAALAFRDSNNQDCPTPTGSSQPRLAKSMPAQSAALNLAVSKPAARLNRILRRKS